MRTPLRSQPLSDNLARPWTRLSLVEQTRSTNEDMVRAAAAGEAEPWTALVTQHQSGGRGRLGRTWTTEPGTALTFSALVPTPADPSWSPLLAGLAVADTISDLYGFPVPLKWPNDVLAGVVDGAGGQAGRKLAGILCELTPVGVVVGIGLNVDQAAEELPVPTATSLRILAGAHPEGLTREGLLLGLLDRLASTLGEWAADPDRVRDEYRRRCRTIGRDVRVDSRGVGGAVRVGRALEVDPDGRLVVRFDDEVVALSAGDVTHVRET
ncbi:MAG: biotin--[acetyl-CoA-carboxylase] ligase [Actinomycetia bacterium]|nr:biotin--[acetyl-CoA-carboxylase] ligase [Actinomycetes bacterium]